MPRKPLLIELDDDLRAPRVGQNGGDKVGLVRTFPLDEEHELAVEGVRGRNDLLCLEQRRAELEVQPESPCQDGGPRINFRNSTG